MNKLTAGLLATAASLTAGSACAKDDLKELAQYVRANPTSSCVVEDADLRGAPQGSTVYEAKIGDKVVYVGDNFIAFNVSNGTENDFICDIGLDGITDGLGAVHGEISSLDKNLILRDILQGNKPGLESRAAHLSGKNPIDRRLIMLKDGNGFNFYDFSKGNYGPDNTLGSSLDEAQERVVNEILAGRR